MDDHSPRTTPAAEPMNNSYAADLSNQALSLGLIDIGSLKLRLAAHALFFDKVVLGASALLANPGLYALTKSDPLGAKDFYGTILAPVVMGNTSFAEIAESMISRDIIHDLATSEDLRAHAAFFDAAKPTVMPANEGNVRADYRLAMRALIDSSELCSTLSPPRASSAHLWRTDFLQWLNEASEHQPLYCSEIYRWADTFIPDPALNYSLKHLADTTIHLLTSETQYASFSTPSPTAHIADGIFATLNLERWSDALAIPTSETEDVVVDLDLELVSQLSLADIAQLRELPPFPSLRSTLARCRSGLAPLSPKGLQATLHEAGTVIHDFARDSPVGRRDRVADSRSPRQAMLRLFYEFASAAVPRAFALFVSSPGVAFGLAVAAAFGLQRLSPLLPERRRPGLAAYGPTGHLFGYFPRTGLLREKDGRPPLIQPPPCT